MKAPAPFISVIITSYNDEQYVARAIESVLQQTYKSFEILLIDNNSKDGTLDILYNYQSRYPEIIKVFEEKKQGCPSARNRGVREARGEWIQIVDSDDEILPQKFEHQLPYTRDGDIGLIVGSRLKCKVVNGKVFKEMKHPDTANIWRALLFFQIGSTNSCLWKKKVVLTVDGWNEAWTSVEDYEMFFRVLKNNVKVAFCPFADSIVHLRDNSMSRSVDDKILKNHIEHAVKLRLMIRDYMKANRTLSAGLEKAFERELYFKLLRWKPKAPDFIQKKIKELNLSVSPVHLMRYRISILKSKTSSKLKKLFNS